MILLISIAKVFVGFLLNSLFHSFPRPLNGSSDLEVGLKTLEGLFKIGFVLAPEMFILKEDLDIGEGRELKLGQRRICFTDLDETRIKEHAEKFGPFSIEFDLTKLNRDAGASPVFYLPENVGGMSGLAEAFLLKLADTKNLLNELVDMKQLILGKDGKEIVTLQWGEKEQIKINISIGALSAVLAYLEYRHGEARNLASGINVINQLFYPTQNSKYLGALQYYRQKEWRIISDIVYEKAETTRELTEEEKEFLLKCNPSFFEKKINLPLGVFRRVDECSVYVPPPPIKHPMELAKRIIVPREYVNKAQDVVANAGFSIPVEALENF